MLGRLLGARGHGQVSGGMTAVFCGDDPPACDPGEGGTLPVELALVRLPGLCIVGVVYAESDTGACCGALRSFSCPPRISISLGFFLFGCVFTRPAGSSFNLHGLHTHLQLAALHMPRYSIVI